MSLRLIIFFQGVMIFIGLVVLTMMIWLPLTEGRAATLNLVDIYTDPFILYGYVASIPFFIALYKVFKLLSYIANNQAFTQNSVKSLRSIKYCAIVLSIFIVTAGLYIRIFHHHDDDPAGFLAMCGVTTFVTLIATAASAKFEKFIQRRIDLKSKNE